MIAFELEGLSEVKGRQLGIRAGKAKSGPEVFGPRPDGVVCFVCGAIGQLTAKKTGPMRSGMISWLLPQDREHR